MVRQISFSVCISGATCRQILRLHWSDPPGFDNQQHDPADERERSDNRRDKVAVGGLNMQAEEIDRPSGSRETDARVSEHHDA